MACGGGPRTWTPSWEDWHQAVVDYRDVSDAQAVVITRATGRAKGSGVPLDTLTGNVLTWRPDGGLLIVAYSDPREALEAVGLDSITG